MNRGIQANRLIQFFKLSAKTCRMTKRQRQNFYFFHPFPSSTLDFKVWPFHLFGHFGVWVPTSLWRDLCRCWNGKGGWREGASTLGAKFFPHNLLQNEWYPFLESGFFGWGGGVWGLRLLSSFMPKWLVSPVGFWIFGYSYLHHVPRGTCCTINAWMSREFSTLFANSGS